MADDKQEPPRVRNAKLSRAQWGGRGPNLKLTFKLEAGSHPVVQWFPHRFQRDRVSVDSRWHSWTLEERTPEGAWVTVDERRNRGTGRGQ